MTDTTIQNDTVGSRTTSLRRTWFVIHQWLGVGLVLIFAVLGVTGTALMITEEIERAAYPQRYSGTASAPNLPLSTYVEAARKEMSATDRVSGIRFPDSDTGPMTVAGMPYAPAPLNMGPPKRVQIFLDPATAQVLEVSDGSLGIIWFLKATHGHLLLGNFGIQLVGWMGVAMFLSCLTGIWIWWPRNGKVLKKLKWSGKGSLNKNLHHHTGIWIALPLAVVALTGVYIAFAHSVTGLVEGIAEEEKANVEVVPNAPPMLSPKLRPEEALALAVARQDGMKPFTVLLPTENKAKWMVNFFGKNGEPLAFIVDDNTGEVFDPPPLTTADKVEKLMEDLHIGLDMGTIWMVIVFTSGFVTFLLGVTGLVMWLRGLRIKRLVRQS